MFLTPNLVNNLFLDAFTVSTERHNMSAISDMV